MKVNEKVINLKPSPYVVRFFHRRLAYEKNVGGDNVSLADGECLS
jgi:hypothetical protein